MSNSIMRFNRLGHRRPDGEHVFYEDHVLIYNELISEIAKLKEANKVLRDAVEFYADFNKWSDSFYQLSDGFNPRGDIDINDLSEIINDNTHKFGGKKAREALSRVEALLGDK